MGAASFMAAALIGWAMTGHIFAIADGWQKPTMLIIEVAAALSIAFVLIALFAGSAEQLSATSGGLDDEGGRYGQ